MVFVPGAIGAVFSFLSGYLMESWDVYQDFMAYLWKLYKAQMEVAPVAYASNLYNYTRFLSWCLSLSSSLGC
jgi:hypothetical protein